MKRIFPVLAVLAWFALPGCSGGSGGSGGSCAQPQTCVARCVCGGGLYSDCAAKCGSGTGGSGTGGSGTGGSGTGGSGTGGSGTGGYGTGGSGTGGSGTGGSGTGGTSSGGSGGGQCTVCPKGCFNLASDPNNCGSCGYKCPGAAAGTKAVCSAGKCSTACTTAGQKLCTQSSTPYCANLQSDIHNCGQCGHECQASGATPTCKNGVCGAACPAGKIFCPYGSYGGSCVDTSSDVDNCGGCGVSCQTKATAAGIPSPGISTNVTISCAAGKCKADISGYAGLNCANPGCDQSCDTLCKGQLDVPCDPNNPPDNCTGVSTGACGYYYELFGTGAVSCDRGYSCSQQISGSDTCGTATYIPLSGINCQCHGTVTF